MSARRFLVPQVLLAAFSLLACTDGRLEVLERNTEAGNAGAAGSTSPPLGGGGGRGAAGSGGGGGGGSGGSAGMVPVSPFEIDDFEDGDTESFIQGGYWYFKPDPTCTGYPGVEVVANRPGNTRAIRARSAGGCVAWGALLGVDLTGSEPSFDASSFRELRFWARAEPGSVTELSVSLLEQSHFDTVIEVTSEWREFVLPLDGFTWNEMGDPHPLDRAAIEHLQFFVFSAEPFDFWLDDLAFTR